GFVERGDYHVDHTRKVPSAIYSHTESLLTRRETCSESLRFAKHRLRCAPPFGSAAYLRAMTVTARADVPRRRVLSTTTSNGRAALLLWALVVCLGVAAALVLRVTGARISIDAPPLHARLGPHIDAGVLFPLAVATLVVAFGLRAVAMLEWRPLLVASTVAASAWAVSLAALRGSHRIVEPVLARGEYFAALPGVRDIDAFIRGFVDHITAYPVHVQGHPPGTVVLLAALRDLG